MRHHFLQLSSMAEAGDLEKIKEYLYNVTQKIPTMHMHFCENQVIDSVVSYYCALAERNTIPFHVQIDLPAQISVDETDFCLVLSNLLENALEASLKTAKFRQRIDIKIYRHASNLILFLLNLFTYTSSATAISDQYTSLPHQTGYVNAHRQISD